MVYGLLVLFFSSLAELCRKVLFFFCSVRFFSSKERICANGHGPEDLRYVVLHCSY